MLCLIENDAGVYQMDKTRLTARSRHSQAATFNGRVALPYANQFSIFTSFNRQVSAADSRRDELA